MPPTERPDASPAEIQRENLIQILLGQVGKAITPDQVTAAVDAFLDPTEPTTNGLLMKAAGISKPTAQRWKAILLAGLEHPPEAFATGTQATIPRPSQASLDRVQTEAHAHGVVNTRLTKSELGQLTDATRLPISSTEVLAIIDEQIRSMRHDKSVKRSDLKQMLDLKIKYQSLEAAREEQIVDPRKLLGARGLAGIMDEAADRFQQLAAHRHEIHDSWHAMVNTVLDAVVSDLNSPEYSPPPELADRLCEIRDIDSYGPTTAQSDQESHDRFLDPEPTPPGEGDE